MPVMDGYELIRQIKKIKPDVKALLMSAFKYNSRYFARNLSHLKIAGFIEKPVSMSELRKVVVTVLNNNYSPQHSPNVHLL